MSTESAETELIKILADLKGNSLTRMTTIRKLGQLKTSDLRIVLALEQVALKDPEPEIREAALQVLNLPPHQRAQRRLSGLNYSGRGDLADEIDRWAKDQIISPQLTQLLKGRLGVKPIPQPAKPPPIRNKTPTPALVERKIEQITEQPVLAIPTASQAAPVTRVLAPTPEPTPKPKAPPKESVPFDQWLLSERNIKIALYMGGALLVLAGIIFIGVNWMRIPGPVKFAITMLVTGLMYLGGFLLFQKPMLRIGGIALLGVASGFLPLIFAVLQIYVLSLRGLADEVMWLIASPMCLLLYILTAYWTRSKLFTFISLAALLSTITAALVVGETNTLVYPLVFALAFLVMLVLSRFFQSTQLENFTRLPLLIVAHVGMPLMILLNLVLWEEETGCYRYKYGCSEGSPWLALLGLGIGGLFYLAADRLFKSRVPRWIAAYLFCGIIFLVLAELEASDVISHYTMLVIPLIYMGIGFAVDRMEKHRKGALPLYSVAGLVALITTIVAASSASYMNNPADLARALFVDVLLLLATEFLLSIKITRWLTAFLFPVAFYFALKTWNFNSLALGITLMILALVYLDGGYALKFWEKREKGNLPLYFSAYVIAIFAIVLAVQDTLALMIVLYLVVVLLVFTNVLLKRIEARWVAAFLLTVPFYLSLDLLNFSQTAIGIALMILALIYMGGGYALERWEKRKAYAWPLYAAAYAIALLVTVQAIPKTSSLIKVLFGDVILLILSAAIHRIYWWVYGAAWLFMLPVYLTINLLVKGLPNQGLLMGVLGLNYTAAGYILGRRALRLGAPFLIGAAFLSLIAVALSWVGHPIASLVLAIVAILYLLAALWLGWPWLLPVTWMAVNLLSVALSLIFFKGSSLFHALTITSAAFGAALLAGGLIVQRKVSMNWGLPLLVVGTINLAVAYLAGIILGGWLAIGLSGLVALYLLAFTWLVCKWIKFPVLTYLGLGVIILGYFFTIAMLGGQPALKVWTVYAAALCGLFVLIAWLLRGKPFTIIYSQPLRWVGFFALIAPMAGTAFLYKMPVFIAITFAIAALTYLGDAALRRVVNLAYIGLGALVATVWAVLFAVKVDELQAYIFPLSLVLLGVGWNESTRNHRLAYRLASLLGLLLLMGSAYYQSVITDNIIYAILLLVECLLSLALGIWQHKRGFVQVGGIALLVNAVTQLGPGFVDLDRWIQIAVIGGLLFGLGLAALFKRQDILAARKKLSDTWRQWEP